MDDSLRKGKKVLLAAFSVGGAMGQYLDLLAKHLGDITDLILLVPEHAQLSPDVTRKTTVLYLKSSRAKIVAGLRMLDPRSLMFLRRVIDNVQPDVIHLFNGEGYTWSMLLAQEAQRTGTPMLVTLHDPQPHPGDVFGYLNARFRGRTVRFATALHVHSSVLLKNLNARRGAAPKVEAYVIPHGNLGPLFLRERAKNSVPIVSSNTSTPNVLFFGRIEAYKGIDTLLEAAKILPSGFRVTIAGPGNLTSAQRREVERRAHLFEVHNRFLSNEEVADLFSAASVCVLPYLQATQSSVPLISATFGVPVVATRVGAFVEDVPRVNGILVSPQNPAELASGIVSAIGRQVTCPKEFEFEYIAQHFRDVYVSLSKTRGEPV